MYRILIILSSIVLLATSCQKETRIDTPATLTYTVVPEVSFEVKSGAEGTEGTSTTFNSEVNSLSYLVYHKKTYANGQTYYDYIKEMGSYETIDKPSNIQVPITLIKDQEYKLVFIAQHRFQSQQRTESYAYTYNNGIMSVNPNAPFTNGEQLEAYVFVDEVGPITGNENRSATLRRIVSQINIGTSAATYPEHLNIAVTGAASSYNVFEGTYAEDASSVNINNIKTPASGTDKIKVSKVDYNRLATLYCLGNNKLGLTLTNAQDAADNFTISNVTTQVNYKTNLVGNILAGTYTVQASNLETLKAALANPKVTHIELTAPIIIDSDITIDGRGVTVTQAASWNEADSTPIITIDNSNVSLKNINFKNTKGALINTNGGEFHAENITVRGHNTASSMITLIGTGNFKNCTFTGNHCGGNGLLYLYTGSENVTLDGNTFSNNTITTDQSNVATVYMGYSSGCTMTNNTIQNNTVTTTSEATAKKISGGLMIGYPATITGNTITGNSPNNVYIDDVYGSIDLTNNTIGNNTTTNIN